MTDDDNDPQLDSLIDMLRQNPPPNVSCLHEWHGHWDCSFCPDSYHIYCDKCGTHACGGVATDPDDALARASEVIARQKTARPYRFNPN